MKSAYTAKKLAETTGLNKTTIMRRAQKEAWPHKTEAGNGGKTKHYLLSSLPSDIQKKIAEKSTPTSAEMLPVLAPEAALIALRKLTDFPDTSLAGIRDTRIQTTEHSISEKDLKNKKFTRWVRIIQEAERAPAGWKKRAWIENVALRHEVDWRTIYKKLKKYNSQGLVGLTHRKSTRKTPKVWTPEAVDFWLGMVLKRSHRKISKDSLFKCLKIEAHNRSWQTGSYESALWWLKKRLNPQLLALQKGGLRALDNTLPPILRDYSDLEPFEILVGDQHRFDFWVVDEETGEVFRPECYMWQDLRTRIIYGIAIDRRYDAALMGMALHIGIRCFGAFKNIYTDNGKPENSRYIIGIMKDMRALGLSVEREIDYPIDLNGQDPEEIMPAFVMPGEHRRAIVKNAKAKMIEGTNNVLEGIMRNRFLLPGNVKRLTAPSEHQDIDQKEIESLARSGKLTTYREFVLAMYLAADYYNREKTHRGVLKEWRGQPKPKSATPIQCLEACYLHESWRPVKLSDDAINILFLPRASRKVDRGRITFQGKQYESDALIPFHGNSVDLRYDPVDPDDILVFYQGEFVSSAELVEYSSMKDHELAERKIEEKAKRRKEFSQKYHELTSRVPDFRKYSNVPALEKAAAIVGDERRKKVAAQTELYRQRTPDEMEAEVAALEETTQAAEMQIRKKPLPPRPKYFLSELERHEWCFKYQKAGGELTAEDREWMEMHEAAMPADQREYWEVAREMGL
ncbi:MAG: transposase [Thermodesulfobacteriota bacterium]|nr:MAG: transposase [Thermodesulfobacteriota bacterium]